MARVRLLVSDIDGTLVTAQKALTTRAAAAVASLARSCMAFTLISSRPPPGMAGLVRTLKVHLPFTAFNGGNLVAPDMSLILIHRLSVEVAARTLTLLSSRGVDAWLFADGAWFLRDPDGSNVARERLTVGFDPTAVEAGKPTLPALRAGICPVGRGCRGVYDRARWTSTSRLLVAPGQ